MTHQQLYCPCGSNTAYKNCCQPLHNRMLTACSAEQLMRSRYSAFCKGNIAYLIATQHSDTRQADDDITLRQTIKQTQWLGLKIIAHKSKSNTAATVEFIAFYQADPIGQLHERSDFIKEHNQWFYVDGEILAPAKLSRNEACFCGSGKKLKKCHNF